jgi:thiamine-phosphate pyrophosphorylase
MNYKKLLEIKKLNFNNKKSLDSKKILSPIFFFTDRKKNIDLNQVIKNLPKNTNIILREYALNQNARLLILQKIHNLFYQKKLSLIIGKSFNSQMLRYINGVHYSDLDFNKNLFIKRNFCKNSNLIFTISMHKLINLHKISLLKPDVIFLSPIFATTSHPEKKPIGPYNFIKIHNIWQKKFCHNKHQKFLPLGGINLQNLHLLSNFKINGFGAIDFFNDL